jgi:hypothetical protein
MIGTKNFWVNLIYIGCFLGVLYAIYLGMIDAKIEAKATIWMGFATLLATFLLTRSNKMSDFKQKDLDSKAPITMVTNLEKVVDTHFQIHQNTMKDHIEDNRESMAALFNQQRQMIDLLMQTKDTNTKENKEISAKLEQVLREARCEIKAEEERDDQCKKDFKNR